MKIRGACALDTETLGETADCRRAQLLCTAVAPQGVVTFNRPCIERGAQVAVHNIPYDPVVLGQWDAEWDCTKVIAWLMGEQDTTLKGLTRKWLGHPAMTFNEAQEAGELPAYCLADAQNTWDLRHVLYNSMDSDTRRFYDEIEKPLLPLWSRMTLEGSYYLDRPGLKRRRAELQEQLEGLTEALHDAFPTRYGVWKRCQKCRAWHPPEGKCLEGSKHKWKEEHGERQVNPASPEQVMCALQDGGVSLATTGAAELYDHYSEHPAVPLMLEFRGASKELTTYVEPWLAWPDDKRLGAIWRPTGTWTGRVSSARPNLQNIPATLTQYFQAAPGHVLIEFDNAQLEVRVAAALSGDPLLQAACRSEDLHGVMQEALGLDDRRLTKVFVFGSMYAVDEGAATGAFGIQARKQGVEVPPATARAGYRLLREKMPTYFRWASRAAQQREQRGLFGRKHVTPEGDNAKHQAQQSINVSVQGGAATVCKKQMLALDRAGYHVLSQVHDSIVIEVAEADEADARREVPVIMAGAADIGVPLKVEAKVWPGTG